MGIHKTDISSIKYELVCKLLDEAVFVLQQTHSNTKNYKLCKCNVRHVLNVVNDYIYKGFTEAHVRIGFSTNNRHVFVHVNATFVLKKATAKWGFKQI